MHKTHHNVNLCYDTYNVRSSKWANCPDYMQLKKKKKRTRNLIARDGNTGKTLQSYKL